MTKRSFVFALTRGLSSALVLAACTATPEGGAPKPGPVDMEPEPSPSLDAKKPDPVTPTPDARLDMSFMEPTPVADGGTDSARLEAAPPVTDAQGAPPGSDAAMAVGARVSLRDDLAARWIGTRRSMKQEDGVLVFTGVFEANRFGGAQGHNVRLPIKPGREYVFEYRLRFDTGFDFSRGGKIPGLAGGNAPTGCVNVDANGFSARMMWREGGKLIGYLYDQDQSVACGNGITTSFTFKIGQWHDVKERVQLNTGSNNNGILQVWIDGAMVINRSNVEYMAEKPTNRINTVLFHSFFGGSTQAWAPSRNCSISFSEPFATLVTE